MPIIDNTEPADEDTEIEPIKIRWEGYARSRIWEYNQDFQEDDSELCSPTRVVKTLERQKTNVVVRTVEEANALRHELTAYDSDQRTWMNSSQDRALNRVGSELTDAMEVRGYEAVWSQGKYVPHFTGYEPAQDEEDEQEGEDTSEGRPIIDVLRQDPLEHYNQAEPTYTNKQLDALRAAVANPQATEDEVAEIAGCTGRYVYDICARADPDSQRFQDEVGEL